MLSLLLDLAANWLISSISFSLFWALFFFTSFNSSKNSAHGSQALSINCLKDSHWLLEADLDDWSSNCHLPWRAWILLALFLGARSPLLVTRSLASSISSSLFGFAAYEETSSKYLDWAWIKLNLCLNLLGIF